MDSPLQLFAAVYGDLEYYRQVSTIVYPTEDPKKDDILGKIWLFESTPSLHFPTTGTPTRPGTRHFFHFLIGFSFENPWVMGNLKYHVLPKIWGIPDIFGMQICPIHVQIPKIPGNTRE